jgi:hypothetical protein
MEILKEAGINLPEVIDNGNRIWELHKWGADHHTDNMVAHLIHKGVNKSQEQVQGYDDSPLSLSTKNQVVEEIEKAAAGGTLLIYVLKDDDPLSHPGGACQFGVLHTDDGPNATLSSLYLTPEVFDSKYLNKVCKNLFSGMKDAGLSIDIFFHKAEKEMERLTKVLKFREESNDASAIHSQALAMNGLSWYTNRDKE